MIAALMVPMNVHRGGFQDDSFASARSSALRAFREIYGPSAPEFQEFAEGLKFDLGITSDISDDALHRLFLETAAQAVRPQDKVPLMGANDKGIPPGQSHKSTRRSFKRLY